MVMLKLTRLATSLVLGARLSAAPPAAAHGGPAPAVAADSAAVLTVDALTKMTAFWTAFKKEPLAIRDTARHKLRRQVPSGLKDSPLLDAEDMEALAAQYPAVAEDFKQAGLTPQQWENFRQAVWKADIIISLEIAKEVDPKSVRGQDVAFLLAHPKELAALKATGMPFYTNTKR